MCESERQRTLGDDGVWRWLHCSSCGSAFVDRAVSPGELAEYYAAYYTEANLRVPTVIDEVLDSVIADFGRPRPGGRLLDVGFGAGTLLAAAERAGWECWGTEVSRSAIQAAQARDWNLFEGDLPYLDLPESSFDAVCMVELLEHVPDPVAQLQAAARLLRPGGVLFGTTPSSRGVSARALRTRWSAFAPPEHLQLISPRGLRRACRRAGLKVLHLRTHGVNPHELASVLKRRGPVEASERVESGYELNARLTRSGRGRALKAGANLALSLTRLGDSLKFSATR